MWSRRGTVAPLALIVSAVGFGAAAATEHTEPPTVVVHDDLGDRDWIETSLPGESAEQKLRSAAEAAAIPVFGVEEVSEESEDTSNFGASTRPSAPGRGASDS
ncbi:MAG: hypothetical protein ABR592_14045 [Nitriliruptorales bacterium]